MTDSKDVSTEENDWEITPDGLYVATRHFLTKRGYCCANRCRNCPYFNWRDNPDWHHISHQYVRNARVSSKAIEAAQAFYTFHRYKEEQEMPTNPEEAGKHKELVSHYSFLLKMWRKE